MGLTGQSIGRRHAGLLGGFHYVAGLLVAIPCAALAHEPGQPHADWFRSLTVPGTGEACCDERDCHAVEFRGTAKGYEVLHLGFWLPVPDSAVVQRKDNPLGTAVACIRAGDIGWKVVCFIRSPET
jgi:hypothetical protein